MELEIKVNEPTKNSARTLTFAQSPVRIGRNQLNDVSLDDPFVSEWHGIIRFDDSGVAYFDLGSTNGTTIAGKRLAKNVPVALTEASVLSLGRIDIRVALRRRETGPLRTIMGIAAPDFPMQPPAVQQPQPPVPPIQPSPYQVQTAPPGMPIPPQGLQTPPPGASSIKYDPAAFIPTPPPMQAPIVSNVPSAPSAPNAAPLGAETDRSAKILEAFCEAFVGLKKGYEQFGSEVGVRTINGRTPLHKAHNSREVLDHLLNPSVPRADAVRDLIAIFADFGIHHIAMMEAVTEGVRSVIQSLDPRANGMEGGPSVLTKSKNKGLWTNYLDRFDQVATDDNELHAIIFGDEFARAYASVTIGDKGKGTTRGGKKER